MPFFTFQLKPIFDPTVYGLSNHVDKGGNVKFSTSEVETTCFTNHMLLTAPYSTAEKISLACDNSDKRKASAGGPARLFLKASSCRKH